MVSIKQRDWLRRSRYQYVNTNCEFLIALSNLIYGKNVISGKQIDIIVNQIQEYAQNIQENCLDLRNDDGDFGDGKEESNTEN